MPSRLGQTILPFNPQHNEGGTYINLDSESAMRVAKYNVHPGTLSSASHSYPPLRAPSAMPIYNGEVYDRTAPSFNNAVLPQGFPAPSQSFDTPAQYPNPFWESQAHAHCLPNAAPSSEYCGQYTDEPMDCFTQANAESIDEMGLSTDAYIHDAYPRSSFGPGPVGVGQASYTPSPFPPTSTPFSCGSSSMSDRSPSLRRAYPQLHDSGSEAEERPSKRTKRGPRPPAQTALDKQRDAENHVDYFCDYDDCWAAKTGFTRKEALTRHQKEKHCFQGRYRCPYCDKSYADSSSVERHRVQKHPEFPKVSTRLFNRS
ncbi:hypothetical protein CYLTODRAFT_417849 [Cylindrobasidium torrendii FP15055 ss-10]|uniref:C2H2-type domain-containing protein n=1 Tax=Cylindrobasidium torrendii FP15055 ss-10 TaxID=1314674 RepID=A0A0D7BPG9_9AGAR|nr:hypothetical protein CYLTODRAFT_417849 [Cylindrobasidium torrendii FP15055 ss-10]